MMTSNLDEMASSAIDKIGAKYGVNRMHEETDLDYIDRIRTAIGPLAAPDYSERCVEALYRKVGQPSKEKPIDGLSTRPDLWPFDSDQIIQLQPETETARFRFRDGYECEIPEPGDGWELIEDETNYYAWPWCHVEDIDDFRDEWDVSHEAGQVWLKDMAQLLADEQVRILWIKRWRKSENANIAFGLGLDEKRCECGGELEFVNFAWRCKVCWKVYEIR